MVGLSRKHIQLNVRELPEGKTVLRFECDPDSLGLAKFSFRIENDVSCVFEVTRSGDSFDIDSTVSFTYVLECSRCLKEYRVTGSEKVLLHYRKGSAKGAGRERELTDEDVATYFYDENVINLAPAVRDVVLLSIPIKPLCSPECRGLCPVCGQNLNEKTCSCTVDSTDPRWDALMKLKNQAGGE